MIENEAMFRQLLGPRPEIASAEAGFIAQRLADFRSYIVSAPDWWTQSRFGEDLLDENVISDIYDEIVKIRSEFTEDLKNKAAAAKQVLRDQDEQTT
jgi:hypothetical protein